MICSTDRYQQVKSTCKVVFTVLTLSALKVEIIDKIGTCCTFGGTCMRLPVLSLFSFLSRERGFEIGQAIFFSWLYFNT